MSTGFFQPPGEPQPKPEGVRVGDSVEVIGAELSQFRSYDGCRGEVIKVFEDRGREFATVHIHSSSRSGKQWFPVRGLRKI